MAHVGDIGVFVLLLIVDGVGVLPWLLYAGDGGLFGRVLHADELGVSAWVLDAGDVGTAVVGLMSLHFALNVAGSHGPAEGAPLVLATTAVLHLLR